MMKIFKNTQLTKIDVIRAVVTGLIQGEVPVHIVEGDTTVINIGGDVTVSITNDLDVTMVTKQEGNIDLTHDDLDSLVDKIVDEANIAGYGSSAFGIF